MVALVFLLHWHFASGVMIYGFMISVVFKMKI